MSPGSNNLIHNQDAMFGDMDLRPKRIRASLATRNEFKCIRSYMMSQSPFSDVTQSDSIKEMLSKSGYSERAIQYYIERPHMGTITNADQVSEMTGTCGDTMGIYLNIEGGKIIDAKYQVLGCAGAISAAMTVVDLIKGKRIQEAQKLVDGDVFRVLQEIPVQKHHCIQLAVKTLHKALAEYQRKQVTFT